MAKGLLGAEAQERPSGTHQGSRAAGGDMWKAGTRRHNAPLRESVAWATLSWGTAPTLTMSSVKRCRDGFSPSRNTQLYSLRAILSLHRDGCGRTRYFNFTALPSVHKTAQGTGVDSSVCHRRWIS